MGRKGYLRFDRMVRLATWMNEYRPFELNGYVTLD